MRAAVWFPIGLISVMAFSVTGLWSAIDMGATELVPWFDVSTIFIAGLILLACTWSSLAYALKRFDGYWASGYPLMLAAACLAYGLLKSSLLPIATAMFVGLIIVGYLAGRKLTDPVLRFVPLGVTLAFIVVGELQVAKEVRSLVLPFCAGALVAPIRWSSIFVRAADTSRS